jgi:hypothetical protein
MASQRARTASFATAFALLLLASPLAAAHNHEEPEGLVVGAGGTTGRTTTACIQATNNGQGALACQDIPINTIVRLPFGLYLRMGPHGWELWQETNGMPGLQQRWTVGPDGTLGTPDDVPPDTRLW